MKSAYELAMERLGKSSPSVKVTDAQKKELAELDSVYAAKIAEREIFLNSELRKAHEKGDFNEITEIARQLVNARKTFQADLEEKKEAVRARRSK